jgi:predicted GTPase
MIQTLDPAFDLLKKVEGKNVILCFGTTGCGKSTMLNSVIHGAGALEMKTH